jgi:hypothetical protein
MKKRTACLFILFFFVMSNFLTIGQSMGNGWGYGDSPFPYFESLTPKEKNLLDLGPSTGGVAFANIAEPLSGNLAVGKPLSLQYDRNKDDGKRLEVLVGDKVINSGLYDWELIPLARYVEVDSWACVSLFGSPNRNDPPSLFKKVLDIYHLKVNDLNSFKELVIKFSQLEKMMNASEYDEIAFQNLADELDLIYEKLSENDQEVIDDFLSDEYDVKWISYNPAMGNTLVGLNLLLVDAMFVHSNSGPTIMNDIIKQVNGFPKISGYNDQAMRQAIPSNELLSLLRGTEWDTYIFSDANYPIYYSVDGDKINFSGFPSYQFMKENTVSGKYEYVPVLNNYMRSNYSAIKALNPVIYNAAEKWCHWSALFGAVKSKNQAAWTRFLNSIEAVYPFVPDNPEKTKYPQPHITTPRFWVPGS